MKYERHEPGDGTAVMLCDGERIDLAEVAERINGLEAWKESAQSVLNGIDLQAVGKELGVRLGDPIGPAILLGIRDLKASLREGVETQALRLAGRSIAEALVAVDDARGALTTIHMGLSNRLSAIHDAIHDAIRAQA